MYLELKLDKKRVVMINTTHISSYRPIHKYTHFNEPLLCEILLDNGVVYKVLESYDFIKNKVQPKKPRPRKLLG